MNKEIIKVLNYDIETSSIRVSDDINKSIVFKVDKNLINCSIKPMDLIHSNFQNHLKIISEEMIEIGFNDAYSILSERLKETLKYIKKVNFKKTF